MVGLYRSVKICQRASSTFNDDDLGKKRKTNIPDGAIEGPLDGCSDGESEGSNDGCDEGCELMDG